MNISSLHVLSKNTDATSSLKGYEYQILKTLEAWLENRIEDKDEQIYCDYEEDIFRYDLISHKAHFKQMKLYSRNFSFASVEVKKALAHFFMLYVKGEYTFDELEFVFESNSDIAQKRGDNNAELLRNWYENQENLSAQSISDIVGVVKPILEKYIADRVSSPNVDDKPALQKAEADFQKLTDEDIGEFVKRIKWSFSDVEPDVALAAVREKVKVFVQTLPFEGAEDKASMLVSRLHYEIWHRATETNVDNKVLTSKPLDKLVLQIGSERDKEYESIYTSWEDTDVKSFLPGEFYQIVDASEYCRSKKYLMAHDESWKRLLSYYVHADRVPPVVKRKAIYELSLLSLRIDQDTLKSTGNLLGLETIIKSYFSDITFHVDEISDALTLLTIIATARFSSLINLTEQEVAEWFDSFAEYIEFLLKSTKNTGDLCTILEVRGHNKYIIHNFDALYLKEDFEAIIPLLEEAETFSTLSFYDRLNLIFQQSIRLGSNNVEKNIEVFQDLIDKIEPVATKRESSFKRAKRHINLGITYLDTSNPKYLLKAIEEFHKAKNYYKASESMEGYILALLNISQVYIAANMLYGAKYYLLCAIWRIIQTNRPELGKRLADTMVLLLLADFRAGAWLSAIDDFVPYLNFQAQFKTAESGPFDDERLQKVLDVVSLVFACCPIIRPELATHIDNKVNLLGWVYDETLKVDVDIVKEKLTDPHFLKTILLNQLVDKPLSDLGKRREISFVALGIKWVIVFNNDFKTNAAGEQFTSILQLTLMELASTDFDFNMLIAPMRIHLVISDQKSSPIQTPTNEEFIWKVYVQEQKTNSTDEIQKIYSRMLGNISVLLCELSLLVQDEFRELFTAFISTRQVKEKTLIENGYEYIYRKLFVEEIFNDSNRTSLEPPDLGLDIPSVNQILPIQKGLSSKYDNKKSLENITHRYKNSFRHFNLTLDYYKDDYFFHAWIKKLRSAGWLDWQIGCGLMNAIVNAKANDLVVSRTYRTERARREAYENLLAKSMAGNEADNFKVIALGRLMATFDSEMEVFQVKFLESFGLYNKPNFPNFRAISNFNVTRLNFSIDDIPELSPFKDIGNNLSDEEIIESIQGFGFFIMEDSSPPVFHFMMKKQLHSLALVDSIQKTISSNEIELTISNISRTHVDVTVKGVNGAVLKFNNIPLLEDVTTKIKNYGGNAENSMFAASHTDLRDGKLLFSAIQNPIMTTKVVLE